MTIKGFFTRLASLKPGHSRYEEVRLGESYYLEINRVRVPYEGVPICVRLIKEGIKIHIYPELLLDSSCNQPPLHFLLFDPDRYHSGISGFMRLIKPGDSFVLGNQNRRQTPACHLPKNLEMRHLSITHDGDGLIFRKLVSDARIELTPLPEEHRFKRSIERRMERLRTIRSIYGGPIEALSPADALETLREVNSLLETEAYRPQNDQGKPGGVVNLPKTMIPIIVGDLHAQVDNLLTLLSQNHFMEALQAGEATLIILGDAVHSEQDDQLDKMESSLLMMDLILRLKLRFPQQLFYIRGNHDSFSSSLTKSGIAQCLIWEATIRKHRGEAYLREMKRFYASLPYVVISEGYVACHAAPVKTRFNMDMLINIYRYPGLVKELTRNRIRQRTSPAGYTRADVRHFRNILNLPEKTPFFVSHSPLDREKPLWLEAGGIENHHIVFSANIPWIGVFTRVRGQMIPLSYHRENLLPMINEL